MNNLKTLSSNELLTKTKSLVLEERRITTEILHCLREIDARKLYADAGYASLHVYCVKELGYSDGGAFRRIESMRVIRDLPEMEEKIREGNFSLTTVAAAGSFMRKRHYSRDEKRALLARVEHKSKRETESLLAEIDPEFARRDSEKLITEELVEIRMTMPKAVLKKLERVKELSSHRNPNPSYSELLELLADAYLKKNEKPAKPVQASPEKRVPTASVRAEILRRAGSACEFVSSGKRCESRHLLQVDHILPWAMGGRTEPANLRLLCFTHNQLEMRRKFGNSPIAQAPPAMAN